MASGRNKTYLLGQLGLPQDPAPPLLGMVSRLTRQKGLDLCMEVLPAGLQATDARLAVLGVPARLATRRSSPSCSNDSPSRWVF